VSRSRSPARSSEGPVPRLREATGSGSRSRKRNRVRSRLRRRKAGLGPDESASVPAAGSGPVGSSSGLWASLARFEHRGKGADPWLVGAVLCLCALGVVMTFSAGSLLAAKRYGDWTFFLKRELVYASLGLLAFTVALRTDYAVYRRYAYPLLFAGILALVAVLLVGTRVGGAVRWFRVGPISFQPSEFSKIALVIYLASLLARKAEKVRQFSVGFLPPLVVAGLLVALLLKQPDLGTAGIFGVVTIALLFVAGARVSYIFLAVLLAAPVAWRFIVGTPWRMRRMLAFLDPWAHRKDAGYQTVESLISIGSGGLTGQGLGMGKQKLFFLPEAHTDFILAVVGEELGLLGLLGVIALFLLLIVRGLLAAVRARDVFGAYLAFGLSCLFGLQAMFNMAVVLGLLPTKGLTLPFVSYGGSSLIVSLFAAGILANISARNPAPRAGAAFYKGPRPSWAFLGRRRNRRSDRGVRVVVDTGRKPAGAHAQEVLP